MMPRRFRRNVGIGATTELSLRVSVATLVRVLFKHPENGELMLALERKATLLENEHGPLVDVKAQPFGGAIRIHNLSALQEVLGSFHFDSEQSRSEQDFRLFFRPADWRAVQDFCLQHFSQPTDSVLESEPTRELVEEFADALNVHLKPDQYRCTPAGTVIENKPSPTENFYARSYPTVRIYRIFEARILDSVLASAMLKNSASRSDHDLRELAFKDARKGGKGWSSAVLTLPLGQVHALYEGISPEARNRPVTFQRHQLDETVAAVLENVPVSKYQSAS